MRWQWLERLRTRPSRAMPTIEESAPPSRRSSQIFDSHVLSEAAASKHPQAISLAYDEGRAYGFNVAPQSWMGMTPRERKETLLSIFLANPWASNCIDTIARYIVSGGISIEPRVENPDQRQYDKIQQFLLEINEDWDFLQYVYGALMDEQIFGETFTEFLMQGGLPWRLYKIDCLTMDTETDAFGRVTKYKQQLASTSVINNLDPKAIIRWWNPHPRAQVDPFSQLERVQDAILLDKKMVNWLTTFFQKGGKYNYYFKGLGDQDEADRFLTYFRANFTGEKNAQIPPVLWGNAEIAPLGNAGPLDMDFDKGLDRMQSIVLSCFHVPPSIACIAELGNRLTDMSDGQRKILQYIACDPLRHRFFEKFNYRLIRPFFGTDYYVSTRYADFRSDKELAEVHDKGIRNGSLLIDEVRQEIGKEAYDDGSGKIAIIVTTKEITPVPRLKDMEEEQRQTAQVTLDSAKANADLAQTKAKQAKEPPAPVPAALQVGKSAVATGNVQPGTKNQAESFRIPPDRPIQTAEDLMHSLELLIEKARQAYRPQESAVVGPKVVQRHTGMMLALLLDPEISAQLAIADVGEPAADLHITLAYLGDMQDEMISDLYLPHIMPDTLNRILFAVTSAAAGPLIGKIAGIGRFTTPNDGPTPVIASVDIPGLTELRTELVDALVQANYYVADTHGYTPHITLAYIDRDTPMPVESVPPLEVMFDTVWLCVGDERTPYKLGGNPPAKESQDGPYPPHTPAAQEAIRADAEETTDDGRDQAPSALGNSDAQSENIVLVVASTPQDASRSTPLLSSENSIHHTSETIEEHHAQPETHPQSDATDALPEGAHEDTGNGALRQAQEAARGDGDRDVGSSSDSGTPDDPAAVTVSSDQQKAELAAWITTFFLSLKQRGSLALPTAAAVLTVYTVIDSDRSAMAQKLAEANLAAQIYAYTRDRAAVGLPKQSGMTDSTLSDLLSWSHAQVTSITQTFHSQLASFVGTLPPDLPPAAVVSEIDPWVDRYAGWKAPQIANATIGAGANTGSMAAIDDMLDADSDPSIDFSTDNVRIRVVPSESSSDYCAAYAGQEYSVSEYLALGMIWPAHPGCPHGIEAYLDDSNDLTTGGEE